MPNLKKLYTLEITPEQFINACSIEELQELDYLCQAALQRRQKIEHMQVREAEVIEEDGWYTREPTLIRRTLKDTGLGHNGNYARCEECKKLIRAS